MSIAIIAINQNGIKIGAKLIQKLASSVLFVPEKLGQPQGVAPTPERIKSYLALENLIPEIFYHFHQFIFIMASGIVIRLIAPLLKNKFCDPGVVVIDGKGQYAISLIGGHEGGANFLAKKLEHIISAQAIITSKHVGTQSKPKRLVVGIGCQKDITLEELEKGIFYTFKKNKLFRSWIKKITTVDLKKKEKALLTFSKKYGIPLEFFDRKTIETFNRFDHPSEKVNQLIGIKGVCEPTTMLGSNSNKLLLPKTKMAKMTISIAEVNNKK